MRRGRDAGGDRSGIRRYGVQYEEDDKEGLIDQRQEQASRCKTSINEILAMTEQ